MAPPTINGLPLISADVHMPAVGAWHVDAEHDGTEALSGSVTLVVEGVTFSGTVVSGRSAVTGKRVRSKIVGGKGGLSKELPAKNYSTTTTIKAVVDDILRECSETLASDSQTAVLSVSKSTWQRSQGPASRALTDVLELAAGAVWRVLANGTIWIGVDTYPTQTVDHTLLDEDMCSGVLDLAQKAPELRPAVTFLGHRITYVVHRLRSGSLRTEAYVTGGPANSFERIFRGLRREIDFSRAWPCRVVKRNSDGTFQLVPDDDRMRGFGMDKVPARLGLPSEVKEVSQGARCLVAFAGGDPSRPYVQSWETKAVTKVAINGGTLPAARQGDLVEVFPLGMTVSLGPVGTVAPASTGTPYPLFFVPAPPAAPTPLPYLYAPISSGNPGIEE